MFGRYERNSKIYIYIQTLGLGTILYQLKAIDRAGGPGPVNSHGQPNLEYFTDPRILISTFMMVSN